MNERAEDKDLVSMILTGDDKTRNHAFQLLENRYHPRIVKIGMHFLHNHEEAHDVAQEVFVRVFQHLPQFRGESKFSTWLSRIAMHVCLDRMRRKRGDVSLDTILDVRDVQGKSPEEIAQEHERNSILHDCIKGLRDPFRKPILLYYFGENTVEDTAKKMGVSKDTVNNWLYRGRQLLKACTEKHSA